MDLEKLRQDFPLLQNIHGGKSWVYLDNACQSLRPRQVLEAMDAYYRESSACSGRSMHRLAAVVTKAYEKSRQDVAHFINAFRKEEIVFTRNTTEAINLVAHSLELKPADVVVISDKEHNSNLIPWQQAAKNRGITLRIVPSQADNLFSLENLQKALNGNVKLVSIGQTSNLDGVTIPAREVIQLAHKAGALVMLDAAQYAPHHRLNVRELDVDFLAFSGHKMLGPSGTGVLYGKYQLLEKMEPFMVGGDTVANSTYESCEFLPPPEKFEAGLQDYAGIIGLGAAVGYLQNVGFDAIARHELELNQRITDGIKDLPEIHLIGPVDPGLRGGIVTFYFDDLDSHRVALMLDQMAGIQVRSGQHCVHSWFNAHQIKGSVRASLSFYNNLNDADCLVENLSKVRKVL